MFRFPSGLVSRDIIETHCVQDRITFRTVNGFDVLDMDLSEEEGGGWIEGKGSLSSLIPLRTDILQGDYRSVYLAWLKAMSVGDGYLPHGRKSSASKPPVPAIPAGLKQLTPALKRFVEQFDVPACIVEAAAEHSPELAETVAMDFRPLVAHLLALEPRPPAALGPGRSIGELLKRAAAIETARKRRQEQEARRKHEAEMKALADHEAETWQQVASLVDLKQTKSYDEAVQLLVKLSQLAEFRGSQGDYRQRVTDLCDRYMRLSGFRWRVERAKLLGDGTAQPMDQDAQ